MRAARATARRPWAITSAVNGKSTHAIHHLRRTHGLRVSELALGTANFGTTWPAGATVEDAKTILTTYAEAGGIFIDTADVYQFGQAETYLADLLGDERDNFVLASKFTQGDRPHPVCCAPVTAARPSSALWKPPCAGCAPIA